MAGPGMGAGKMSVQELYELFRTDPERAKQLAAEQRARLKENLLSQPGITQNMAGKTISGLDPSLMRHQVGTTREMGGQSQVYDYRMQGSRYSGGWYNQQPAVEETTRGGTYQIPRPWTPQTDPLGDEGGPWIGPRKLTSSYKPRGVSTDTSWASSSPTWRPHGMDAPSTTPFVGSHGEGASWRPHGVDAPPASSLVTGHTPSSLFTGHTPSSLFTGHMPIATPQPVIPLK